MDHVNTWWTWVQRVAQTDVQVRISEKSGIDQPTLSRWKEGKSITPERVVKFARGIGVPVMDAFVAAGWITPEEAGQAPSPVPVILDWLDDDDLIDELRARLRRTEGTHDEAQAAPMNPAGGSPADDLGARRRPPANIYIDKAAQTRAHTHREDETPGEGV